MIVYKILYVSDSLDELKQIPKKQVVRIVSKIELLSVNPFPSGVKKLKGKLELWRIRVGDYRVIYTVIKKELIVEIIRIRHRKEVYDNL